MVAVSLKNSTSNRATIGGIGLTGLITRMGFRMSRIGTNAVRVTERRIRDLEEFRGQPIRLSHVCDILEGAIIKRRLVCRDYGVAVLSEGLIAGLEHEDAEEVLKLIQRFDPVGVAARSLQECLLIQAEVLNGDLGQEAREKVLQRFRDKRAAIEALIENQPELTTTTRRNMLKYVDSFYGVIDKPRRVRYRLEDACL